MPTIKDYIIILNSVTEKLPKHLHKFIVQQPYVDYTAQNQAVWRYVMRLNVNVLKQIAHKSYLSGLKKTGINEEDIPKMEGMNRILKDIGWAAVAVDGFIPPNAFMEFQAYNVLVISSEIRTIDHINYTPAPDIIHEAAGHAPIIANPEYSEYLRRLGEIGCKAISSPKDDEMYEAIRLLSILKENPNSTKAEILEATNAVNALQEDMGPLSEMAKIRNLHWWTVEYGLIGTLDNPKLYGAGLLSSIEESQLCLKDDVKKIPYSIEAAEVNFDITTTQPQLFVIPNFASLSFVLEKFANTMAIRKGGLEGLKKLIVSKKLGTIELSTGIQVSGIFNKFLDTNNTSIYFQTNSPTALSVKGTELIGHGTKHHPSGFGSPVGKLEGINIAIEDMSPKDLEVYGIVEGKTTSLTFEGGIKVKGKIITGKRDLQGKIILITFKNCKVTHFESVLFDPSWGVYDMAIGKNICSAFAGPADSNSFQDIYTISDTKTAKITYTDSEKHLHQLYETVKNHRIQNTADFDALAEIFKEVQTSFPSEWLILLELYELVYNKDLSLMNGIYEQLLKLKQNKHFTKLIADGLDLIIKK
ncbi:MAG: aromatic amino acid hydroxylase [Flavobacteriaceae bacterium]|nr:aromatic amino acid hydroxylase [Flavobacteriaceae bacterium]